MSKKANGSAQSRGDEGRGPLEQHVGDTLRRVLHGSRERKDRLLAEGDVAALGTWQQALRSGLAASIGLKDRAPGPVACRTAETLQVDALCITKLVCEAPRCPPVPALLYHLAGLSERQPGLLFLCGHEAAGKQELRYQEVCQLLALQGFVVLCSEVAGQGERREGPEGNLLRPTAAHDAAGLAGLAAGRHPAAFMMQEAMAALSVLAEHPLVDSGRLMVTGNSGGGLQSMLLALLDGRVGAAAVGTFLSSQKAIFLSGKAQDAEQVWPESLCESLCVDHDDLMAAFAPRPLLVLAASQDFFPVAGTRESVASARRFYRMYGQEARLELFVEDCTHQYTHKMAKEVGAFAARHLGLEKRSLNSPPAPLPAERLQIGKGGNARWAPSLKERCTPQRGHINLPAARKAIEAWEGAANSPFCATDSFVQYNRRVQVLEARFNNLPVKAYALGLQGVDRPAACDLFLMQDKPCEAMLQAEDILSCCSQGRVALAISLPGAGSGLTEEAFGKAYNLNSWLLRFGKSLAGLFTAAVLQLAAYGLEIHGAPVCLHAEDKLQLIACYAARLNNKLRLPEPVQYTPEWLFARLQADRPAHSLWAYVLPGMFSD